MIVHNLKDNYNIQTGNGRMHKIVTKLPIVQLKEFK